MRHRTSPRRSVLMLSAALTCLGFLGSEATAQGVERSDHPLCDWQVTGQILPETVASFEAAEETENLGRTTYGEVLCLNSPGGNIMDGAELFQRIWDRNIVTAVPDSWICESACSIAFLGGSIDTGTGVIRIPTRIVYPGGHVGVHAPSLGLPANDERYSSDSVNSAFAAAIAASEAITQISITSHQGEEPLNDFLLRRILGTPPGDMYIIDSVAEVALAEFQTMYVSDPGPLNAGHFENICDLAVARFLGIERLYELDELGEALAELRQNRHEQEHALTMVHPGTDEIDRRSALMTHYPTEVGRFGLACEVLIPAYDAQWHRDRSPERYEVGWDPTRSAQVNLYTHEIAAAFEEPDSNSSYAATEEATFEVPVWFAYEPMSPINTPTSPEASAPVQTTPSVAAPQPPLK